MDWINNIGNMDNQICDIAIKDSSLIVHIKLWDETMKQIKFINYRGFKEKQSIGRGIGDIIIQTSSTLLDELRKDVMEGDGTLDEIAGVKSITFYDSWNETIILEVLAESAELNEFRFINKI